MSDFKVKMYQIQFPLGELTVLPQTPCWIKGAYFEGEGQREGRG